ncbi:hypothetical protein K438DRAFT_1941630 [Mycena galopus ATCC 62051]|nr:hypothetical protein K438DRAFT_1941630 [Mycena galopus ATCC 62051]
MDSESYTVKIYGGRGGDGGKGGEQGGGGGIGEGPTTNFRADTMNLVLNQRLHHKLHRPPGSEPSIPIHTGAFIAAGTLNHGGEQGINILHRAVALEALYDSAESYPQPSCHPDTRTKILFDLYNWVTDHLPQRTWQPNKCAKMMDYMYDSAVEDDGSATRYDDSAFENNDSADEDDQWVVEEDDDLGLEGKGLTAKDVDDPSAVGEDDHWVFEDDSSGVEDGDSTTEQDNSILPQPICWLHGPAGAGKSAIMQTLCQRLKMTGRLGGAFFFQRGHATRGNAKVLFATLAYQLALNNRNLHPIISRSMSDDPSVVGRSMDVQLRQLIVEPCQSIKIGPPQILLIDGLDECHDEGTQREIIRLVRNALAAAHPHSYRVLIASRPEAYIREIFENPSFDRILKSMNIHQCFRDVETVFRDAFARIHREHRTMVNVPTPWPLSEVLEILVRKSSGYFVYASTVIKFIDDQDYRPTERLAAVQNLSPTNSDAPFAALDQLYTQILSVVPGRFWSKLRDILQCVLVFKWKFTPLQLDRLFELEPGDVRLILRRLHSVLDIPLNSDALISAHHASFLDFLQDQRRSSIFHLDPESCMNVARAVLKQLSNDNHCLDDPLVGCLTVDHFIKCIDIIPPSSELIPQIKHLNPDMLFWGQTSIKYSAATMGHYRPGDDEMLKVLQWLSEIRPLCQDVIQRWEDYHFMFLWDTLYNPAYWGSMALRNMARILALSPGMLRMLQTRMPRLSSPSLIYCRHFVARAQGFARIFQARWLLWCLTKLHMSRPNLPSLYLVRLLLGISQDDMIATLTAARSMIDRASPERGVGGTITILALTLEHYPASLPSLFSDLSCGLLRLIQRSNPVLHSPIHRIT